MKRHLCATALLALALIPDWASACWPRWGGPAHYAPAYHAPVYHTPIYYPCTPQPVYVVPAAPPVIAPPRIEPLKKGSTLIEPARPIAQPTPAPKPPQPDPVRPAGAIEAPKPPQPAPRVEAPPARPEPAPAPPAPEPKRGGLIEIPDPPKLPPIEAPKLPSLDLPKVDAPKPPAIELPAAPGAAPKLPSLDLPKVDGPKLPSLDPPGGLAPAVPSAAPAPDLLIPVPGVPTPKGPDALPPFTLPPDTPVAPATDKPVEVKSSPLTGAGRELKVSVFPATGTSAATGLRKVGFYNHTARDLALTIEGKTVKLPAMSYIHAQVPASFTWKCGDKPVSKETVPADAAGVDVLIRE